MKRFLSLLMLPILSLATTPTHAHDIDVVALAEKNRMSVVSVHGEVKEQQRFRRAPFERFFPFAPDLFGNVPRQRPQPRNSSGSGFVIDKKGYILTNAHVIRGMDAINVVLATGDEYKAEVVGRDDKTDIALLKIEAEEPLTAVILGDSDDLQVGESVLAIGSPYGLDQTVTRGIISALGRRLPSEDYVPFIQTDAAVNPGNSGGPLIDKNGKVIGINSQIISPVGAFAGVSFAIPVNVAVYVSDRLREDGVVRRGRLGIYFSPVSNTVAKAYGLETPKGALIDDVVEGTAADEAGLKSGDILLAMNDVEIADSADLPRLIGRLSPGTEVELKIWREEEEIAVNAVLGSVEAEIPPSLLLGLQVENLNDEMKQRIGLDGGVRVVNIVPDEKTPDDIRQIRPNDIITHILVSKRRQLVVDREDLVRILSGVKEGAIALYIWRNGRRIVVPIDLDR